MHIPEVGDKEGIFQYARSFNAYEIHGGFDAAAKIAVEKPRRNIDDLRTELFMQYRASNHRGDDRYIQFYAEIKPILEEMLGCLE